MKVSFPVMKLKYPKSKFSIENFCVKLSKEKQITSSAVIQNFSKAEFIVSKSIVSKLRDIAVNVMAHEMSKEKFSEKSRKKATSQKSRRRNKNDE